MTVLFPKRFHEAKSAGNDGLFDWDFLKGAFPREAITPMDFDAAVEVGGHYLIFETKDVGVPIPVGQMKTLARLLRSGRRFTLLMLKGKLVPVAWRTITATGRSPIYRGLDCRPDIFAFCKMWGNWADDHPVKIDDERYKKILAAIAEDMD